MQYCPLVVKTTNSRKWDLAVDAETILCKIKESKLTVSNNSKSVFYWFSYSHSMTSLSVPGVWDVFSFSAIFEGRGTFSTGWNQKQHFWPGFPGLRLYTTHLLTPRDVPPVSQPPWLTIGKNLTASFLTGCWIGKRQLFSSLVVIAGLIYACLLYSVIDRGKLSPTLMYGGLRVPLLLAMGLNEIKTTIKPSCKQVKK